MNKINIKQILVSAKMIGLLLLLSFLAIYALGRGLIKIDIFTTLAILQEVINNSGDTTDILADVIYYLRLPRFIMAFAIGWGLAVSGVVMQAVLRNPLADPYLLGISSGAGVGAIIAIIFGLGNFMGYDCIGLFAFIGAVGISLLILGIAYYIGRVDALTILLIGLSLNAVCTAIISFMVAVYGDAEGIQSITYWLMGSLANAAWLNIKYLILVIGILSVYFWWNYRVLNLMLLGDEASITLGYSLTKSRRNYILLVAIMVGIIVYNSGMIGFVGLIIPHIVRACIGNNHLWLLPLSALAGACFLVWGDVIGRTIIAGAEVPIGVVVTVLGAPLFVYLLLNKKYGFGR